MESTSRIAELAAQVQFHTTKVDQYLHSNGLPGPSFGEDGPVNVAIENDEVEESRLKALESSLELHDLLIGPAMCLRPVLNGASLQAIYKYDIASKVPIHGEISFKDLAAQCQLDEITLRRMVRFAIAYHRVFLEPRKGFVAHSAASRKLAEDESARSGLGYMFDECYQAFASTIVARENSAANDEPTKAGWSFAQSTDKLVWDYYAENPHKAKRFSQAMSCFTKGNIGNSPQFLLKGYPWASLAASADGEVTVVDVGGSRGDICIMLAKSFPELRFVVQDLPKMSSGAEELVPAEIKDRLTFMSHDFFETQPVQADLYLFRYIFHNWPDSYVVKILKALVPALKPSARVLVNDSLLPEPNTLSLLKERQVRDMDMIMMSLFNSRDREAEDWHMLFQQADTRFGEPKIWVPEGATLAIIEVVWRG